MVIWLWDYRMSSWGHGLKNPMSWAMEISEKQKSGKKAVMLRQKLLFIFCPMSYASPEYLFASQVGLASKKMRSSFHPWWRANPQKRG